MAFGRKPGTSWQGLVWRWLADWAVLISGWRAWALLLVLCGALYLPGLASMPVLDRDEARFMQASRQMLETKDFVVIRFQQEQRNKKPAGIYWLQAASVWLFGGEDGQTVWPYRLPSALGATLAVLLTFALGVRIFPGEGEGGEEEAEGRLGAALIGAVLLASSVLLAAEAHLAKTDAVQLAAIVAAQGALGRIYCRSRAGETSSRSLAVVFWLAQAAGILIKGPVTPFLSLLTVMTLCFSDRSWRWLSGLHAGWGVPLMLLPVLPWFIAIQYATSGAFAGEAVGHDLLAKLMGAQEAHGAPPGYYLALLPVTFWPSALFLLIGLVWAWRRRGEPAERFLLCWAVPAWLLFEMVPTKLPHYILPAYPALALLAGRGLVALDGAFGRQGRWWRLVVFIPWALVAAVFAVGALVLPVLFGAGPTVLALLPGVAILLLGRRLWRQAGNGLAPMAAAMTTAVALVIIPVFFAGILPGLDGFWLSRSAAALVAGQTVAGPVDVVGYSEPSLVFYLGTGTNHVSAGEAVADLGLRAGAMALVADDELAGFTQALAARGLPVRKLDEVQGINYSRGSRKVTLSLYKAAE